MSLRIPLILLSLLIAPLDMARAADATACTQSMAMIADQGLTAAVSSHWSDFYDAYKKWAICDDGDIAEGFSDSAVKLFANHLDAIGDFIKLIGQDNDFRYFAIKHLDETDDLNDLVHTAQNAIDRCPAGQKQLCDEIWAQAKFPDVAAWLRDNADKKKAETGNTIGYYPEYNIFVVGDLVGSSHDDLAVAFTLEGVRGGNDWLRYIAVFTRSPDPASQGHDFCCVFQIGGKGIANDDKIEIKNQEVVISEKAFVAGKDAECCPSKQQSFRLKIQDGKLVKDGH